MKHFQGSQNRHFGRQRGVPMKMSNIQNHLNKHIISNFRPKRQQFEQNDQVQNRWLKQDLWPKDHLGWNQSDDNHPIGWGYPDFTIDFTC